MRVAAFVFMCHALRLVAFCQPLLLLLSVQYLENRMLFAQMLQFAFGLLLLALLNQLAGAVFVEYAFFEQLLFFLLPLLILRLAGGIVRLARRTVLLLDFFNLGFLCGVQVQIGQSTAVTAHTVGEGRSRSQGNQIPPRRLCVQLHSCIHSIKSIKRVQCGAHHSGRSSKAGL